MSESIWTARRRWRNGAYGGGRRKRGGGWGRGLQRVRLVAVLMAKEWLQPPGAPYAKSKTWVPFFLLCKWSFHIVKFFFSFKKVEENAILIGEDGCLLGCPKIIIIIIIIKTVQLPEAEDESSHPDGLKSESVSRYALVHVYRLSLHLFLCWKPNVVSWRRPKVL